MKKICFAFVLTVVAVFLVPPKAFASIIGSAHDFSSADWNTEGEVCVVCHTLHGSGSGSAGGPLWNHDVTNSSFTLYSSSTLDASPGQPDGVSKLCLSCHDGTVALDSYGGATGTTFIQPTDSGYIGTDLSGSHPISFTYNSALATADGGLYDPTTQSSGLGSTIDADLLTDSKMECNSCHDVHNGSGVAKLLVKSNSGSALCSTCHDM